MRSGKVIVHIGTCSNRVCHGIPIYYYESMCVEKNGILLTHDYGIGSQSGIFSIGGRSTLPVLGVSNML